MCLCVCACLSLHAGKLSAFNAEMQFACRAKMERFVRLYMIMAIVLVRGGIITQCVDACFVFHFTVTGSSNSHGTRGAYK